MISWDRVSCFLDLSFFLLTVVYCCYFPVPAFVFSIVTSKLNILTTATGEESHQIHSINAFIEVLGCQHHEAEFYLESSCWDIQTAVVLWLENNPTTRSSTIAAGNQQQMVTFSSPSLPEFCFKRYQEKVITIEGLDPLWIATVDPFEGHIIFCNKLTGNRQKQVPKGFADLEDQHLSDHIHSGSSLKLSSSDGNNTTAGIHPSMFDEDNNRDDEGGSLGGGDDTNTDDALTENENSMHADYQHQKQTIQEGIIFFPVIVFFSFPSHFCLFGL
jgi:hypothetical protein